MGYRYDEGIIRVNITDHLQERAEAVPPAQWRTFLLEPHRCGRGRAVYRKQLPRYVKSELADIGYEGAAFEALYFQHAFRRGVILLAVILVSLAIGIGISIKNRDISAGFTVAAWMGIPLSVVIALFTLFKGK